MFYNIYIQGVTGRPEQKNDATYTYDKICENYMVDKLFKKYTDVSKFLKKYFEISYYVLN